jgi:hypothetical protein
VKGNALSPINPQKDYVFLLIKPIIIWYNMCVMKFSTVASWHFLNGAPGFRRSGAPPFSYIPIDFMGYM